MIAGKYTNELVFGNKPEDIEGYEDAITSDEMYVPHHVLEYKYTIDELVSLNRYDKVSADELIWMPQSVHNRNSTLHKSVRLCDEAKKGRTSSRKGVTLSEETKRKMSESQKGEKNHNYGKHLSEETKRKLSEAQKNISDETRKKLSESLKGRTLSEETRKKISEARKAYWRNRNQQV